MTSTPRSIEERFQERLRKEYKNEEESASILKEYLDKKEKEANSGDAGVVEVVVIVGASFVDRDVLQEDEENVGEEEDEYSCDLLHEYEQGIIDLWKNDQQQQQQQQVKIFSEKMQRKFIRTILEHVGLAKIVRPAKEVRNGWREMLKKEESKRVKLKMWIDESELEVLHCTKCERNISCYDGENRRTTSGMTVAELRAHFENRHEISSFGQRSMSLHCSECKEKPLCQCVFYAEEKKILEEALCSGEKGRQAAAVGKPRVLLLMLGRCNHLLTSLIAEKFARHGIPRVSIACEYPQGFVPYHEVTKVKESLMERKWTSEEIQLIKEAKEKEGGTFDVEKLPESLQSLILFHRLEVVRKVLPWLRSCCLDDEGTASSELEDLFIYAKNDEECEKVLREIVLKSTTPLPQ